MSNCIPPPAIRKAPIERLLAVLPKVIRSHLPINQQPSLAALSAEAHNYTGDTELPLRVFDCPSCGNPHYRPARVRSEPLRTTPRTDTVPIARDK